jgi:pimeloyl-ACP methyl ester carboxylesterase
MRLYRVTGVDVDHDRQGVGATVSRLACVAAVLVATLAFVSPAAAWPPSGALSLVDVPQPGAPVGSVPAVEWSPCPDLPQESPALECARYEVPLDYDRPDGRTATLPLTRLKATGPGERLGSLFLNPGGPGGSGTGMPADPGFARLAQRFDLIGFDPRGAGASTPAIECDESDELVARWDAAKARPDRRTGPRRALIQGRRFARSCRSGTGRFLRNVGTDYAARDLDRLRAAVGDEKLNYLGFSYGTYLGTVYADEFPSRVRAVVLDGALDPDEYGDDFLTLLRKNYRVSERALTRWLAWCGANRPACAFGGDDPRAALDALIDRLDAEPLIRDGAQGREVANGYTVVYALYLLLSFGRPAWGDIAEILTELDRGNPVLTNRDLSEILGDPSPNVTIECTDSAGGVSPKQFLKNANRSWDLAPTFAPALTSGPPSYDGANGAACAHWPLRSPASDYTGDFRAQGADPILVVGNTRDPSTPYSGAVTLTDTLDNASLLTLVGDGHTSYSRSQCIRDRVDAYLIDRTLPEPGVDDRCLEDPLQAANSRRSRARASAFALPWRLPPVKTH